MLKRSQVQGQKWLSKQKAAIEIEKNGLLLNYKSASNYFIFSIAEIIEDYQQRVSN
jgi:hypothetical protein